MSDDSSAQVESESFPAISNSQFAPEEKLREIRQSAGSMGDRILKPLKARIENE